MPQLLLLEDNPVLSREICEFLHDKGYDCDPVFYDDLFFRQWGTKNYSAYLLDTNLPHLNGLEVCKAVRKTDNTTPILMLSNSGEIEDKTKAFVAGADDYLIKPFHLEELHLRIDALCRRAGNVPAGEVLTVGDLKIDLHYKVATRAGQPLKLTAKEFNLLTLLARAQGRTLSKKQIVADVWNNQTALASNTVEVYINFLRNKIDKPFESKLLHTKVGFGYALRAE